MTKDSPGLHDYGIGAIVENVTPPTIDKLKHMFALIMVRAIDGMIETKELQAGDRIDMRFHVTKKGVN